MYVSNIKWTKKQTITLISLLKQNSCLYDNQNPNYTNNVEREKSYQAICKHLCRIWKDTTIQDVKAKIRMLRLQYSREKRGIELRKEGAGIEEAYNRKLWCYEDLKFLDASMEGDAGTSNINLNTLRSSTGQNSSDDISSGEIVTTKKQKRKPCELEERASSTLDVAQGLGAGAEELFCKYLSAEIKNIKLDHIFCKLKMDMLTLVYVAVTNDKEERKGHAHFNEIIEYKECKQECL